MRIALDTNVWSFLADRDERIAFENLINSRNMTVVLPPGTLLEVLRTTDVERRRRIIEVLTHGKRHYLRSDAALESDEVIAEARRLRPLWLRARPRTDRVASLDAFWTKRIWRIARQSPERLVAIEKAMGTRDRDTIVANQRRNKEIMGELRKTDHRREWKHLNFSKMQAILTDDMPPEERAGWPDSNRVDAWRAICMITYWRALMVVPNRARWTGEDTTYADWIGSYLALDKLGKDRADFNCFWYCDVQASNMPRNWLRWAIDVAQWERRITDSNPGDAQQGSWLVDADIYLTADRRFAQILDMVEPHFPGSFMATIRVVDRTTPSAVDAIARVL
jgi:predicted nucleic acid-binding protein